MSFESFDLHPALLRAVGRSRLHRAHADPGARHSRRARRARPAGRGPDRHRQDGRVRAADPAAPAMPRKRRRSGRRAPRALVLVPTRELAAQVAESFQDLGRHLKQRGVLIFGGVSPKPQVKALAEGVDIIVATPGRLLDHLQLRAGRPVAHRSAGARRGRSHAGHGLHPPDPQADCRAARAAAEPAVLGDFLRRDPRAGARHPAQPAEHRHRAAQCAGRADRSSRLPRGHAPTSIRC